MDNYIHELMRGEAIKQYPNEACGLIVAKGKKSLFVPCNNIAPQPKTRFIIDPVSYAQAAELGEVIAVWHSHVNEPADPSEADRVGCEANEVPWYITGISKHDDVFKFEGPVLLEPCGYQSPYLERPYVFGVQDCYSLVIDYYKREFGIALGDYPRIEGFWKQGINLFMDNLANENLLRVDGSEPQVGDLFVIQASSPVANHMAIYIGDDMILHHPHGRLSCRDIYGGYWQKHTVAHVRHASKC